MREVCNMAIVFNKFLPVLLQKTSWRRQQMFSHLWFIIFLSLHLLNLGILETIPLDFPISCIIALPFGCFNQRNTELNGSCKTILSLIILNWLIIINSCLTSNSVLQRVHADEYLTLRWTKNLLEEFLPPRVGRTQRGGKTPMRLRYNAHCATRLRWACVSPYRGRKPLLPRLTFEPLLPHGTRIPISP